MQPELLEDKSLGNEITKLGYSLFIWLSDNRLECFLSYVPNLQGDMITSDELMEFLAQHSITEGLIDGAVQQFLADAAEGKSITRVLIAEGIPPINGKDACLVYIAKPSTPLTPKKAATIVEDVVDFHIVQTFINVLPGDEIARITLPEPGIPGRSVTGADIPPQPGKPVPLTIGKHIEIRENDDGLLLLALTAGRVCEVRGGIDVFQEYIVAGDVDFRVGSITFNGFVEVRGDVLDGFTVDASKGLKVDGNIGSSTIRSDGNIVFCGMDGGSRGTIRCGGTIKANFIHDADVECAGDIEADVEIHNSSIKSLGKIIVNRGAIVGGSCCALGGVQTFKAGSSASVKTYICAGLDYRYAAKINDLIHNLEKINTLLGLTKSKEELDNLTLEKNYLSEKLQKIMENMDGRDNPKINIKKRLHDNTWLRLGASPWYKGEEKEGNCSISENRVERSLCFSPLTSLDSKVTNSEGDSEST